MFIIIIIIIIIINFWVSANCLSTLGQYSVLQV